MESKWESSVLNCFDGDDDCATCKFIAGDRSTETLLDVIKNLDHMLAKQEALVREMTEGFIATWKAK